MKTKKENCPICQNPSELEASFFPFCSSRCQLIDLGNWLGEKYQVAGEKISSHSSSSEELNQLTPEIT